MEELERLKSFKMDYADFSIGDFTIAIKRVDFEEQPAPPAPDKSQAGRGTVYMTIDAEFDEKVTDKEISGMQKYIRKLTGEVDSFIECRDNRKTTVRVDGDMLQCKPEERKVSFKMSISDIMFLE